ncbi:MAG: ABC transporter permease [Candidatus Nealsonbacteria bacterium]|nr:MAG: ABC transporter permease [Candidatus Nealsonbacteria bacterium]
MSKRKIKENLEGYIFIIPWLIGFALFWSGPMIATLILSFYQYNVLTSPVWIGLGNYIKLFFEDKLFWISLYNTAYYVLFSVPLSIIVGLSIALLLNQKVVALSLWRTIYYFPTLITGVAASLLWIWVLNPTQGLINTLLEKIGIPGPLWLQSPHWSKPALILMSLWWAGQYIVIYLAGLQGIPTVLYEAAELDGANRWQKLWNITIPLMTPVLFFNLIMAIIGSFQIFTQAYIMTQGGPLNSTHFYVYHLYILGFERFYMGRACAMAWILLIIILSLTLGLFKSSSRWVYYEGKAR